MRFFLAWPWLALLFYTLKVCEFLMDFFTGVLSPLYLHLNSSVYGFHDIFRDLTDSSAHSMAQARTNYLHFFLLISWAASRYWKNGFLILFFILFYFFCISFNCFQLGYSFLQGCDRNLTSVNIVNAQSYPVTVQFQLNNNDSANGSCDYHLSNSDSTNTYILQVTNRDSGNTAFNLELSNSISSNATCNNQLTNGTSSNVCSTFQLTNENETSTPRNTVLNQLLQTQHNDWIHRKRGRWIKKYQKVQ